MRLGHALELARMLTLFFARKVLSVGALRSTGVRVCLVAGAVLLTAICTGAAYLFLRPLEEDPAVWRLVLDTTTISAVLWTQFAFLFVKLLFVNSEGLLELSFHLPLTGRERAVALLLYEAATVLVVASVGFLSVSLATLLLRGFTGVLPVLESVAVPVLLTYALLGFVYALLLRALSATRLRRAAPIIGILLVFALLLAYLQRLSGLVSSASEHYLTKDRGFSPGVAVSWLDDRLGAPLVVATGLGLAVLLVAGAVWLTPRQYVRPSRYLKLLPGSSGTWLTAYDRCLLRSSQTWLSGLAACCLFALLCLHPAVSPLWAASLLPMGGLYLFAATEPLRAAGWDRSPATVVYLRLLRAQLLLVAGGAVLMLGILATVDRSLLSGAAPALGGCVLAAVLTTFIGVVFPAERDNPLSVLIGMSSAAVVIFLIGAALGVLQVRPSVLVAILVALTLAMAGYTVIGIHLYHARRRHEKVAARPQQPGRRRDAHRAARSGDVALPHVLDR